MGCCSLHGSPAHRRFTSYGLLPCTAYTINDAEKNDRLDVSSPLPAVVVLPSLFFVPLRGTIFCFLVSFRTVAVTVPFFGFLFYFSSFSHMGIPSIFRELVGPIFVYGELHLFSAFLFSYPASSVFSVKGAADEIIFVFSYLSSVFSAKMEVAVFGFFLLCE